MCGTFQHDKQRLRAWVGPFQAQIVIDQLRGLRCEGEEAQLVALAANAELSFGQQHILRVQSQHLGGAKPMHEHQADDGQVARGMEACPEACHFIDGERHDIEPGLPHTQPAYRHTWTAKTHRLALQESLLKPMSDLTGSIRERVSKCAIGVGNALVDAGCGRPRLQVGLKAQVIEQGRLGEVSLGDVAGVMHALPPANEVQQVVGVDAQAGVCQPANMLAIQIIINPLDSLSGALLDHLIRAMCAGCVLLEDHLELHG